MKKIIFGSVIIFLVVIILITLYTQQVKTNDKNQVIDHWRPRVASLSCDVNPCINSSGVNISALVDNPDSCERYTISGSGVLEGKLESGAGVLLTNKHVAKNLSGFNECKIIFPDNSQVFTTDNKSQNNFGLGETARDRLRQAISGLIVPKEADMSRLILADVWNNLPEAPLIKEFEQCKEKAPLGTEILVLGYPGSGGTDDITVTEGVIASYEDNYYVTDAKIDSGNSGGAAIWIEKNCFLGLPTAVIEGDYETLGRILMFQSDEK